MNIVINDELYLINIDISLMFVNNNLKMIKIIWRVRY